MNKKFELSSPFEPSGAQPEAIKGLVAGLDAGLAYQTVLGVTGSGKTFTMANVINAVQRPAVVLAPNKTLAAQLYSEFKAFFPKNAVEYFVSYYDYYQPEAYVPSSDTYIEKDASINDHIEQMRLSATKALLERSDVIIVATVSAIYGLGDPQSYLSMVLHVSCGEIIDQRQIIQRLAEMQYTRNDAVFERSTFRVRGDVIDVFPADAEKEAVRISLFDDEVERIQTFDPLTNKILTEVQRTTIFPKTHYVTPREKIIDTIELIKEELKTRLAVLKDQDKLLEHQRLDERTRFDIEMMLELGYCSGIENYSRYLSGRKQGEAPPTLLDYLPDNAVMFVDESHIMLPQIGGMFRGDQARKENLVNYGFRLPSALDNRPLRFDEFEALAPQMIFVSATPGDYEEQHATDVVELLIRPTGLLDPQVEVRPVASQVDDLLSEIHQRISLNQRVLVTTLTKRMAEDLSEYYLGLGIKVRYLHSDIDTMERVEIIRDLRLGVFDVLIGINLLREGLDMPEVSLVAILDADKEGFLRSTRSLIQTMGRAARHLDGTVILYADHITGSMQRAMDETTRRREIQSAYNDKHHIVPQTIEKEIVDILGAAPAQQDVRSDAKRVTQIFAEDAVDYQAMTAKQLAKEIAQLEQKMLQQAANLEFEDAAATRDRIMYIKQQFLGVVIDSHPS